MGSQGSRATRQRRTCSWPGCTSQARKAGRCAAHAIAPQERAPESPGSVYQDLFSAEEWGLLARQLGAPSRSLESEVAMIRLMIRRVLARLGEEDPVRALPLVRQAVETLCRALRTGRVLENESADGLAQAMATALREIGEELGLGDGG